MTEKKKADSPRKLFVDRMRRENRFEEYRGNYRKYMDGDSRRCWIWVTRVLSMSGR